MVNSYRTEVTGFGVRFQVDGSTACLLSVKGLDPGQIDSYSRAVTSVKP